MTDELVELMARAEARSVEEQMFATEGFHGWEQLGLASLDAWVDGAWRNYAPHVQAALRALNNAGYRVENTNPPVCP